MQQITFLRVFCVKNIFFENKNLLIACGVYRHPFPSKISRIFLPVMPIGAAGKKILKFRPCILTEIFSLTFSRGTGKMKISSIFFTYAYCKIYLNHKLHFTLQNFFHLSLSRPLTTGLKMFKKIFFHIKYICLCGFRVR